LVKDRSAIEVAIAIEEQFNAFESLHVGGRQLVENELERRGFNTEGVEHFVAEGWNDFETSEKQYTEIIEGTMGRGRGDLTTAASLRLYASVLGSRASLNIADRIFLTGSNIDTKATHTRNRSTAVPHTHLLLQKANRLGIPVIPYSEIEKTKLNPLFAYGRSRPVPSDFEQINEDMFAKKDNKFMVFNGAGIDSWKGTHPLTRISHVENIILATL
jgi:hypothetical protein